MTKQQLLKKRIGVISLGCDKNRVDTEHMLGLFDQYGFKVTNDIKKANIIIVNTCSFIHDAKLESIETILESASYKTLNCEKLIVTGCLTQIGLEEIKKAFPEVDAFVKIKEEKNIISIIEDLYNINTNFKPVNLPPNRIISTKPHYAYLKISDGCNNKCSYCTIPFIRGKYISEPIEALVAEAKGLVKLGVKELILVAQDVTRYGIDLYKKPQLVKLIQELSQIEELKWIRLHYCYPEMVKPDLIKEINSNPKVCKYLDIPLQHINSRVLKSMNRSSTKDKIEILIKKLKKENKDLTIRSTFIVGFPGETNKEFKELANFLTEYKLNNVGFFTYSKEAGTTASIMKKQISKRVKNKRIKKLQVIQEAIVLSNNEKLLGKEMLVICDGIANAKNFYVCRSEQNSPEVDAVIYVYSTKPLKAGEFYKIKITEVVGIDLQGELV